MKQTLFILLLLSTKAFSQTKPFIDLGAAAAIYTQGNAVRLGGNFGLRFPIQKGVTFGIGVMPLYYGKTKDAIVPAYGDLRIDFAKNVALTLQPGYNFYDKTMSISSSNVKVTVGTKGQFYGGAGFTVYGNRKGSSAAFMQIKYNYFGYQVITNTYSSGSANRTTVNEVNNSAISIGVGVALQ